MEDINGGLHPAEDGQSLDEDEDEDEDWKHLSSCHVRTKSGFKR